MRYITREKVCARGRESRDNMVLENAKHSVIGRNPKEKKCDDNCVVKIERCGWRGNFRAKKDRI